MGDQGKYFLSLCTGEEPRLRAVAWFTRLISLHSVPHKLPYGSFSCPPPGCTRLAWSLNPQQHLFQPSEPQLSGSLLTAELCVNRGKPELKPHMSFQSTEGFGQVTSLLWTSFMCRMKGWIEDLRGGSGGLYYMQSFASELSSEGRP